MHLSLRLEYVVLFFSLISPVLSGSASGSAVQHTSALDDFVLFDFEADSDLAGWSVRDLTDVTLTSAWSSHGGRSAAVTYQAWAEGKEQWPAIIASGSVLKTKDFTPYRYLLWEAHNPGRRPVQVKLHLRDAKGRFSRSFSLAPGETSECRVAIADLGLDAAGISELHFYVTRPAESLTVFVDHVRLSYGLIEDARELCARVIRLAGRVRQDWRDAEGRMPPALHREVEAAGVLRHQCDSFLATLLHASPDSLSELEGFRGTLAALTADADRIAGVSTCIRAARYADRRGGGEFLLTPVSSMRKVFLSASRLDVAFGDAIRLCAARNEHEHVQAVIIPYGRELENVTWSLTPLRGPGGRVIPARIRLVGYVNCSQPSYTVSHTGWWPDPLLPMVRRVDRIRVGEVQPLWLTVSVPSDAVAGRYSCELRVKASGTASQVLPVALTVWDFALPEGPPLRTALSFRALSSKLYAGDRISELTTTYENWMLQEYGLNPGNIYRGGPPDWSAARLRELMAHGLNAINLSYFNAPRGDAFKADAYWSRFARQVAAIEAYMPTVEAAGARHLCYFYCFDERPSDQLDVVFETARRLKAKWPDIEVMTTAYDGAFGLDRQYGDAVDIWVPLTPKFDTNAGRIADAREKGRDIWWYICIGPKNPYANWFVEYSAIEPRLIMGAMTAKYQPGGFLYYAVNRWPRNDKPITSGPKTDWNPASYKINNGDGSIMCAGPEGPLATLRLENIRDGLEDLAYYQLVRRLHARKRGVFLRTVDTLLWPARLVGLQAGCRHNGTVPKRVVRDLSHFTVDPSDIEAERKRLAAEILRLR